MECTDCGTALSEFMADMESIGRLDAPRCFPCYLEAPSIAMAYDAEPHVPNEHVPMVNEALSDTLSTRLDILFNSDPAEGVVVFTRTEDEADTINTRFRDSAFEPYIESTNMSSLTVAFSEGHERFAWDAANWSHDPYGRPRRSEPICQLVAGIPCTLDTYRFMSEETKEDLAVKLRREFFEQVGKEGFDSLAELRKTVGEAFPFITETTRFVTQKVVEYYRRNPDLIPTTFKTYEESSSGYSHRNATSREELERIYNEEVEDAETYQAEIIALLEAVEGARSSDVAEVVGCSVGHARRFTYDSSAEAAFRKDWSEAAESEKVSPAKRDRIIERDGECRRCDSTEELRVHHIVPIAFGGESAPENLVTLCEGCHKDAHDGAYNPPTTAYDGVKGFEEWEAGN